jgi:hypothetical protein
VHTWKMWFALVGGAVAWTAHLMLAYVIAEFGCVGGLAHRTFLTISVLSWMLIAMSAVMTAAAAGAVVISYRIHQRARLVSSDVDDTATAEYVGRFGLIANAVFLFVVLVQCVPIFFYWGHC